PITPPAGQEPAADPLVVLEEAPTTAPGSANGFGDALPLLGTDGHVRPMGDLEAETIRFAIDRYRGRMTEVARRPRTGRWTRYRHLQDLGFEAVPENAEMRERMMHPEGAPEEHLRVPREFDPFCLYSLAPSLSHTHGNYSFRAC